MEIEEKKNIIYLVGFMGTGKTLAGEALSKLLSAPFLDTDKLVEEKAGMPITEIFDSLGEEEFRRLESRVLSDMASGDQKGPLIVSCGGGIVLSEENRSLLKESGHVILLAAEPKTILRRIYTDRNRPLLENKKSEADIEKMLALRKSYYSEVADVTIDTDILLPEEIAQIISDLLFRIL